MPLWYTDFDVWVVTLFNHAWFHFGSQFLQSFSSLRRLTYHLWERLQHFTSSPIHLRSIFIVIVFLFFIVFDFVTCCTLTRRGTCHKLYLGVFSILILYQYRRINSSCPIPPASMRRAAYLIFEFQKHCLDNASHVLQVELHMDLFYHQIKEPNGMIWWYFCAVTFML